MKSTLSSHRLVFEERGKPEYPKKHLSEQSREPTNSTHISANSGRQFGPVVGTLQGHPTSIFGKYLEQKE